MYKEVAVLLILSLCSCVGGRTRIEEYDPDTGRLVAVTQTEYVNILRRSKESWARSSGAINQVVYQSPPIQTDDPDPAFPERTDANNQVIKTALIPQPVATSILAEDGIVYSREDMEMSEGLEELIKFGFVAWAYAQGIGLITDAGDAAIKLIH